MSQPAVADDVLRGVPSHGWVGRRERALLTLSRLAGLSYPDIADLTTADITISDGTARIRTRTATITVQSTDDTTLCGPCALARWLHLLDMTVIYPNGCVAAAVLARSAPLVGDSPHACQTTDTTVHAQPNPLPAGRRPVGHPHSHTRTTAAEQAPRSDRSRPHPAGAAHPRRPPPTPSRQLLSRT